MITCDRLDIFFVYSYRPINICMPKLSFAGYVLKRPLHSAYHNYQAHAIPLLAAILGQHENGDDKEAKKGCIHKACHLQMPL